MRRLALVLFTATTLFAAPASNAAAPSSVDRIAFVTAVAHPTHVRQAATLLASLREFGGPYREAPFVVVADRPERLDLSLLTSRGAEIVSLEMPAKARGFPFARKVFAAAQAEALVAGRAATLAWFDAGSLILKPPTALDLGNSEAALAVRPVTLVNRVGLAPDAPIDAFWSGVYRVAGVDPESVPTVTTVAQGEPVRAYLNCEIISVRPSLGLFREWAGRFETLLANADYRAAACGDDMHKIFLHQAVLSAVIVARTDPARWRDLPLEFGYPLNAQDRLREAVRAESLDSLACVIVEGLFEQRPDWPTVIGATPRLRDWIEARTVENLRLGPRIYREEGACNSYLVTTDAGNVIVDPGGADPDRRLAGVAGERGVEAILLTHAHADHTGNLTAWRRGRDIPVIAQRGHAELREYFDRFEGFFARRNAVFSGRPFDPATVSGAGTQVPVTRTFDERTTYELGGIRFVMIHTPGETPDTSTVWIPELGAACVADNFYDSFPNLATLRGTRPRWALDYVRALETVLALEPSLLLPGHGEPIVGRAEVARRLTDYRDAVLHVHDATVAGMNEGKDAITLMREIRLPEGSEVNEYFGRVSWAVRGIWDQYAGWFDGNVTSMYPLSSADVYPDLVSLAGGADAVAALAARRLAEGEALASLQLTDVALAAVPGHRTALQTRVAALQHLRGRTFNWIERQWLSHAIGRAEAALAEADAAAASD